MAKCVAYCEVHLSWSYGPEISYDQNCQATDDKCQITDTATVATTNSHSFNVGFSLGKRDNEDEDEVLEELLFARAAEPASPLDRVKAAFDFGASWTWSDTKTDSIAKASTKPENAKGQCGYWSFVPYYITSCGSLTYAPFHPHLSPLQTGSLGPTDPASCGKPKTIANFCQSTPYTSGGKAVGSTVFVATECESNKPLSFCYQQVP